jgi:hypothetical protein
MQSDDPAWLRYHPSTHPTTQPTPTHSNLYGILPPDPRAPCYPSPPTQTPQSPPLTRPELRPKEHGKAGYGKETSLQHACISSLLFSSFILTRETQAR